MIIIGLVGGIGSGKSLLANVFENLYNAYIISDDEVGHQSMMPTGLAYQQVIDLLGTRIIDEDGFIDRLVVSDIVFKDHNLLIALNRIIHRVVFDYLKETIDYLKEQDSYDFIMIEAALLIVDEFMPLIDRLWYVKVDVDIMVKRLIQSRHISKEQIERIMEAQPEVAFYETYADVILNNNDSLESCLNQIYNEVAYLTQNK
ncbi:MAG: dephospho-CoA kinase [Vallitaleaceae bacterium]|jgi:dephospho-CoA kinase|nr:dephospho-CoA kinase [Vallitaleaceae bacterium]